MSKLRQDEMRAMVRSYFQSLLEGHADKVNAQGLTELQIQAMRNSIWILDDAASGVDTGHVDGMVSPDHFRRTSGISDPQWLENEAFLTRELWKAQRDSFKALLVQHEQQEGYDFHRRDAGTQITTLAQAGPAKLLQEAINDYLDEQRHTGAWRDKTIEKVASVLDHLTEIFSKEAKISALTIQDAQEAKKILLRMPVRRKVMPQTRDLTIREAANLDGLERIDPKTANNYIQTFAAFFSWSVKNGYSTSKLFNEMQLATSKVGGGGRKPFDPAMMQRMHLELTRNPSGLVRSESHKWGTLLGMFTGARLNEICQLHISDIKEEDGIPYIHITDDGDGEKQVKTLASKRKVPLHSALIDAGFMAFYEKRKQGDRLFPDYPYNAKNGYGRNLGRWFNEKFAPALGFKSKQYVFHSFRHTMITRLLQASIPDPLIKNIVGHEQVGVTHQVYAQEGYTLLQLRDALEQFCPFEQSRA